MISRNSAPRNLVLGRDLALSLIRMALTRTSETIPVSGGRLLLGTWDGIFFLFEPRSAHPRVDFYGGKQITW